MNKLDIEKCNDIHKLRDLCIEYYKTLFMISETCIDVSKWHISSDDGIRQVRDYLVNNDHNVSGIFELEEENENSYKRRIY